VLKFIKNYLDHRGSFSARILARHKEFWQDPDCENVRNTVMNIDDPIEKWKNAKNWQRKLSNKYNSRKFAEKYNCRVAQLYWQGSDVDEINFDLLPENYVIRPTIGHSAKSVFLMKNHYNLFDKKTYSSDDIKRVLKQAIDANSNLEFLIEEFLKSENGEYEIPKDYKIFCFNGQVGCIVVANRISPQKGTCTFYTENWEQMKAINKIFPEGEYERPPLCLNEMLTQAKILSKAYEIFIRIDFYATDKGAVFGEFTPTPGLGCRFTKSGQKLLLTYWDKYCFGKI
jgi:hypothetical protein